MNGKAINFAELILQLNEVAGNMVLDVLTTLKTVLVGIKSREVYEAPGAMTLIKAHKELEDITLVKEVAHFKPVIEKKITEIIYKVFGSPIQKCT